MSSPSKPNVLVTGTPGTGKSLLCQQVAEKTGFVHIDVGRLAVEKGLCQEYDTRHDCSVIDEDLVCDALEECMQQGGYIIDYHSCDFFPERSPDEQQISRRMMLRWFDLVLVLQTDNTILYDRLVKRGYSEAKVQENVTCEIMQVILEEARESYREDIVQCLRSDAVEEMESNVDRLCQWIEQNT